MAPLERGDTESTASGDTASTRSPDESLSLASSLTAAWKADHGTRVAAAAVAREATCGSLGDACGPADGVHSVPSLSEFTGWDLGRWGDESRGPPGALVVWDWDDTLCPTTWLCREGLSLRGQAPTPAQQAALDAVDEHVCRTLRAALRLGTNVIVTNAERGWVELSARAWLPKVEQLCRRGVRVVSARSAYEPRSDNPATWKALAFAAVTREHLAAHDGVRTLLSIGDSAAERQAALQVWPLLAREREMVKAVKLPERPSAGGLVQAHSLLATLLPTLISHSGHLDLALAPRGAYLPNLAKCEGQLDGSLIEV